MKRTSILSIVAILAFSTGMVQAQVLDRFIDNRKDTAVSTVFQRTGREADKGIKKGINKQLDKIFGAEEADTVTASPAPKTSASGSGSPKSSSSRSSSTSNAGYNALMGRMGISTGTANVKPSYDFDGFIEMTIINYTDGNKEDDKTVYKTFIDTESFDYGMEFKDEDQEGTSYIIFDSENSLMLTLGDSDGEKTGFAISYAYAGAEPAEAEETDTEEAVDAYSSYKTGKTKNILGYKCEEYRIENETDDDIVTMWVTDELNKEMKKSYLQNSTFTGMFMYAYYTNGVVMEYILEDNSNNEKTVMTVTDIDLNKKNSISTHGYSIMNMGGVPAEEPEED